MYKINIINHDTNRLTKILYEINKYTDDFNIINIFDKNKLNIKYQIATDLKNISVILSNESIFDIYIHLALYSRLIISEYEYYIILQDNIEFNNNFNSYLNNLINLLPYDPWDIIFINNYSENISMNFIYDDIITDNNFNYIINKNGAIKLMNIYKNNGINDNLENFIFHNNILIKKLVPGLINNIHYNKCYQHYEPIKIYVFSYDIFDDTSGSGRSLKNLCNILKKNYQKELDIVYSNDLIENDMKILFGNNLPNIIISQQWAIKKALSYSNKFNIPLIVYIHGPGQYEQFFGKYTNECSLVIFCSEEQKNYVLDYNKLINYHIQHPIINLSSILVKKNNKKKYITMICSKPFIHVKGLDIFIKIAKKMSNQNFMIVGDLSLQDVEYLSNICVKGKIKNMYEVYEETYLLLLPSRHDPFPSVIREAIFNNIHVIASELPTINQLSYNLAITIPYNEIENIDLWINEINQINIEPLKNNALEKYKMELENSIKNLFNKICKIN